MKFALLALVATASAAAIPLNGKCVATDTCSDATTKCCFGFSSATATTASADGWCKPKVTVDSTAAATTGLFEANGTTDTTSYANTFFKIASCTGPAAAGAANLAATVAAAATALYAMC